MFARTDRLLLRPGWAEDAPQLHAAIADEAVAYKLARLPWPYSLEDAASYLGRDRAEGEADCLILLRTPGSPTLIGGVGIARRDGAHCFRLKRAATEHRLPAIRKVDARNAGAPLWQHLDKAFGREAPVARRSAGVVKRWRQ